MAIFGGPSFSVYYSDQLEAVKDYKFLVPGNNYHTYNLWRDNLTGWIGWTAGISFCNIEVGVHSSSIVSLAKVTIHDHQQQNDRLAYGRYAILYNYFCAINAKHQGHRNRTNCCKHLLQALQLL